MLLFRCLFKFSMSLILYMLLVVFLATCVLWVFGSTDSGAAINSGAWHCSLHPEPNGPKIHPFSSTNIWDQRVSGSLHYFSSTPFLFSFFSHIVQHSTAKAVSMALLASCALHGGGQARCDGSQLGTPMSVAYDAVPLLNGWCDRPACRIAGPAWLADPAPNAATGDAPTNLWLGLTWIKWWREKPVVEVERDWSSLSLPRGTEERFQKILKNLWKEDEKAVFFHF